jgi:hypothetical protein
VFALLALLVGLGVQQLKPRVVRLPRIAVVPGVFLAWGLIALSTRASAAPTIVLAWLTASMLGAGLGWSTTRLDGIRVDRRRGLIYLPGGGRPSWSASPSLLRSMRWPSPRRCGRSGMPQSRRPTLRSPA